MVAEGIPVSINLGAPVSVEVVDTEIVVVGGCALGFVSEGQPPHVLHVDPGTDLANHGIQADDVLALIDGRKLNDIGAAKDVTDALKVATRLGFERKPVGGDGEETEPPSGDEEGKRSDRAPPAPVSMHEASSGTAAPHPEKRSRSRGRHGHKKRRRRDGESRKSRGSDAAAPPAQAPPPAQNNGPPPMWGGPPPQGTPPPGWGGPHVARWPPPPEAQPPPGMPAWHGGPPPGQGPPPPHMHGNEPHPGSWLHAPPAHGQPSYPPLPERGEVGGATLVVERVPYEVNHMDHIEGYFSRFGPLTNVQINHSRREAVISFRNAEDADKALYWPPFGDPIITLRPWKSKEGQLAPHERAAQDRRPRPAQPEAQDHAMMGMDPMMMDMTPRSNLMLESSEVMKKKAKAQEVETRRKALLQTLTDQIKTVLGKINDGNCSEQQREKYQTILGQLKEKMMNLTPQQESATSKPTTAPAKPLLQAAATA